MRLEQVSAPPHFWTRCICCGERIGTLAGPVFADLDGKPFVDYYCESCRREHANKTKPA